MYTNIQKEKVFKVSPITKKGGFCVKVGSTRKRNSIICDILKFCSLVQKIYLVLIMIIAKCHLSFIIEKRRKKIGIFSTDIDICVTQYFFLEKNEKSEHRGGRKWNFINIQLNTTGVSMNNWNKSYCICISRSTQKNDIRVRIRRNK